MTKVFHIVLFIMTGILPLLLGGWLTYQQNYYIAIASFVVAVFGFQQVCQNFTTQDLIHGLKEKITEQEIELGNQKKEITQKLADVFAAKVEHQEKVIARQKKDLAQASKFLEQRNREIRLLRECEE